MRLLVSLLLIGISLTLTAQDKRKWYDEPEPKKEEVISELTAGDYLIKSAKSQATAMIFAGVGSGIIIAGNTQDPETMKLSLCAGMVCYAISLASTIVSISYMAKAGKILNKHFPDMKAQVSPTGIGLALYF